MNFGGPAGQRQTPAFNARQMFADTIYFGNRRAAIEQAAA